MKCDELIAEKLSGESFGCEGGIYEVYGKEEVDAAIAELEEALKIKDDLLIENGHEIGSLMAENERLEEENRKLVFALSEAVQKQGFRNLNIPESLVKSMEKIAEVRGENEKYIEQLRGEVSKWHKAYDALLVERNAIAHELHKIKKTMTEGA